MGVDRGTDDKHASPSCPRCGVVGCNDPDSKGCSDNCIGRLQRELAEAERKRLDWMDRYERLARQNISTLEAARPSQLAPNHRTLANAIAAIKPEWSEWNVGEASKQAWKDFVRGFQMGELVVSAPVSSSAAPSVAIRSMKHTAGRFFIEYNDGNKCDFRTFAEFATFMVEHDQAIWAIIGNDAKHLSAIRPIDAPQGTAEHNGRSDTPARHDPAGVTLFKLRNDAWAILDRMPYDQGWAYYQDVKKLRDLLCPTAPGGSVDGSAGQDSSSHPECLTRNSDDRSAG